MPRNKRLTAEEKREIVHRYRNREQVSSIAVCLQLCPVSIYKVLKEENITSGRKLHRATESEKDAMVAAYLAGATAKKAATSVVHRLLEARPQRNHYKNSLLTRRQLRALFAEMKNWRLVSQHLGLNPNCIWALLRRLGIKDRQRAKPS